MRDATDRGKERMLGRQQTDGELLIWRCLRGRRLHECKFRRRHRAGPFYLDFVCLELGLIIELNDPEPLQPRQRQADDLRTLYLERQGYRVLRCCNGQAVPGTGTITEETERQPWPPSGR